MATEPLTDFAKRMIDAEYEEVDQPTQASWDSGDPVKPKEEPDDEENDDEEDSDED